MRRRTRAFLRRTSIAGKTPERCKFIYCTKQLNLPGVLLLLAVLAASTTAREGEGVVEYLLFFRVF